MADGMKRLVWVVAVLVGVSIALGAVGGCGKGGKDGGTAGKKDPSGVEVISAGDEPRTELRWTASVGDVWRVTMSMDMTSKVKNAEVDEPGSLAMPVIETAMDVTVKGVEADGTMSLLYSVGEMNAKKKEGVTLMMLGVMQRSLQQMRGMSANVRMSGVGKTEFSAWSTPEGLDPNVAALMNDSMKNAEQFVAMFPLQPVGVGAKWRTAGPLTVGGMTIDQVQEFTVNRIDSDGGVELAVTVTQSAKEQDLVIPGMATADMKMRVLSMSGTSSGTMKIQRGMPMAKDSTLRGTSQQKQRITIGGESSEIDQTTDLEVKVKTERKGG